MSVIAGVFGALPPYRYSQRELTDFFLSIPGFEDYEDIVRQLHTSAKVNSRHLVIPLERYPRLTDFGVANQIYIDNALALGATRWRLYRTVILPAIFPELRSTILLSLGTGWGATLGAEYLGAQSGLGYIIVYSEQFAYLDRMFLIALVIVVYACVSYAVFNHIALKALAWMPRGGTDVVVG